MEHRTDFRNPQEVFLYLHKLFAIGSRNEPRVFACSTRNDRIGLVEPREESSHLRAIFGQLSQTTLLG